MSIQWYPGHMHKASKEISKTLSQVDLIIEVLDARIPYSSDNPMLERIRKDKPCIKLLNKSDLAGTTVTAQWQTFLEATRGIKTLTTSTATPEKTNQLPTLIQKLLPARQNKDRVLQAMITGIPNVGKSTLINRLAGKAITQTGNEPAITKSQQRIKIKGNIILHDTPGMLWPKIENHNSSYRLAVTGAIKDTATDNEDMALFAADYLLMNYPELIKARYSLTDLPDSAGDLLEIIGRLRGCLRAGGNIEYDKAAKLFLTEIRSGTLGPISFETPEIIEAELAELAIRQQREQEKKALRKKTGRKNRKTR